MVDHGLLICWSQKSAGLTFQETTFLDLHVAQWIGYISLHLDSKISAFRE